MSGRSPRWFTGIKYQYESVFADNTWAQIIEACQLKKVPASWAIGDQKVMTIDGTDYPIDIIGFNHDDYADGSGKAPITFQLHDCYGTLYALESSQTNANGWAGCKMRTTHIPAILALAPSEVQDGIREVSKLTSAGNKSSTIVTTADKGFLLSEIEIYGTTTRSATGEGQQHSYYASGGSTVKYRGAETRSWHSRSPATDDGALFARVGKDGGVGFGYASNSTGVAFAFCF